MEDMTCREQWCFTLDLANTGRLNIRASSNGGEDWIFLGPAPENKASPYRLHAAHEHKEPLIESIQEKLLWTHLVRDHFMGF